MAQSSALPVLPEGPVTIMFTDIEGSTGLRTSLGDRETDELFGQHDEFARRGEAPSLAQAESLLREL